MLTEETLAELKTKLPRRYTPSVINAYKKRFNKKISRFLVMRFLAGETYSQELHEAILDVASTQQILNEKTTEVLNA